MIKQEKGFILAILSLLMGLICLLVFRTYETFNLEIKIEEAQISRMQAFYQAESRLEKTVNEIQEKQSKLDPRDIKRDACSNRYFQIQSQDGSALVKLLAEYVFWNSNPPRGCLKSQEGHHRIWWIMAERHFQ